MKLEFGNLEHIKMKNDALKDNVLKELTKKVKCPYCKAPVVNYYQFDFDRMLVGWNFDCDDDCPNSFYYSDNYGNEKARTFTDFNGKFIKGTDEDNNS